LLASVKTVSSHSVRDCVADDDVVEKAVEFAEMLAQGSHLSHSGGARLS
jgi:hypothetical protein